MLNRLNIRTKLLFGFTFIAFITAVVGIFGIIQINSIDKGSQSMYDQGAVPLVYAADIASGYQRIRTNLRSIYISADAHDLVQMSYYMDRVEYFKKDIDSNLKKYQGTLLGAEDEKNFKDISQSWNNFYKDVTLYINEIKDNKLDVAKKTLLIDMKKSEKEMQGDLDTLLLENEKGAKDISISNHAISSTAQTGAIASIIIAVVFALGLGLYITSSLTRPIGKALHAATEISRGNLSVDLDTKTKDETGKLLIAMKSMAVTINNLVHDTGKLSQAAIEGKLDVRTDTSNYEGEFKNLVVGINGTMDAVIGPLNVAAEYVDRISKGDIPPIITDEYKGDFNEIKNNLNQCIESISNLVDETGIIIDAAKNGKLDTRSNAEKQQGVYRKILRGFNEVLDNVIGPLNVAAEYVDRISKGDIPPRITDEYKGDFNEIKNNLNVCIDAVNTLVKDAKDLSAAAVEGKLKTRADATRHQGDFRAIVQGVNSTLDAVITPINESAGVLSEMAHGNLTKRMVGEYHGDMDDFKTSINQLGESLNNVLSEVLSSVTTTSAAAVQISATADTLAAASEEQSSQADEVASAVEEMSRTITENAMSASRTAEVAERNGTIAKEGGDVVEQTVTKMKDIADVVKKSADNIEKLGESSKEIGEIISVIDDIADQTNLLALNAAIEAARAGEQGRGFAVVADEVRKLAERTTEATKQIAKMIKGIQGETQEAVEAMKKGNEEVKSGISLADRAGKSLQEIVTSSRDVQDMISQIAAASEEQSSTSEEIAKNVSAISMVTNDSTKQIQEVASSADGLAKLTEQLQEMVGQFTLDNGGGMTSKNLGGRSARHLTA